MSQEDVGAHCCRASVVDETSGMHFQVHRFEALRNARSTTTSIPCRRARCCSASSSVAGTLVRTMYRPNRGRAIGGDGIALAAVGERGLGDVRELERAWPSCTCR